MELKINNIEELKKLADVGPNYDVKELREATKENPKWLAFGTGNIFRQYIASINQALINKGLYDSGIIVSSSRGPMDIDTIYRPYDNLALAVSMDGEGKFETELIASMAESLDITRDIDRLEEVVLNDDLQIISYIITEKGYSIKDAQGNYNQDIKADIENSPVEATTLMGKSTYLLYQRYLKSKNPVTMLSMDNVSANGDVLKEAITSIAKEWADRDEVEDGFIDYLNDDTKVSFPITMIDKITPGPEEEVAEYLRNKGFSDAKIITNESGKVIAPFTNAEHIGYLVVEDKFANGRPPLEEVGVYLTDRDTVEKTETMKVTTCLNPLHTALAIYGTMLGYDRIYETMEDEDLLNLVKTVGYKEGLPVVEDPKIIDPKSFIDEVVYERFPNPVIPDMPQRIATDTSQKLSVRYGHTIGEYIKRDSVDELNAIPLIIAGWIRYLMGIDDNGERFDISPDPLLEDVSEYIENLKLGEDNDYTEVIELLKRKDIFGYDLVDINMDKKVLKYLDELTAGVGAIRKTLKNNL